MKTTTHIFLLFFGFIIISACATAQSSRVSASNPEASVRQLEAKLTDARSRNIDVLSPGLYKEAEASFAKAKQAIGQRCQTICNQ